MQLFRFSSYSTVRTTPSDICTINNQNVLRWSSHTSTQVDDDDCTSVFVYNKIGHCIVYDVQGNQVRLNQLWSFSPVVVVLFRRFGCPFTRVEAKVLSQLKPHFDKLGVRLVGIGFDHKHVEKFVKGGYWTGELYLDPKRYIHRYFSLHKTNLYQTINCMFKSKSKDIYSLSKRLKVGGDMRGDGFQLGGTIIFNQSSSDCGDIAYTFRQKLPNQLTPIASILKAVKGDTKVTDQVLKTFGMSDSCSIY